MTDPLSGFPAVVEIPVQWGDLDAYGHLNNTIFFRFFEAARVKYLDLCGFIEAMERDRVGAILHSTDCRFRRALFYPDTVRVGGRATGVGKDRFTMEYVVYSTGQQAVAAEGHGVIVSFDYDKQEKTALPATVRATIERLDPGATKT